MNFPETCYIICKFYKPSIIHISYYNTSCTVLFCRAKNDRRMFGRQFGTLNPLGVDKKGDKIKEGVIFIYLIPLCIYLL